MVRIIIFLFTLGYAQSLDVTFRYVETPSDNFVRVFIPGTMPEGTNNDWGPNSNGFISPDAPSQMVYNEETSSYDKSYNLNVDDQYLYKIHFHHNSKDLLQAMPVGGFSLFSTENQSPKKLDPAR